MTGATQTIHPFSADAADGIWTVVKLANGNAEQKAEAAVTARQLFAHMAPPRQLGYWRGEEIDDHAVAEEWHNLRTSLRAVANDRPEAVTRLIKHFDAYRQLQTEIARHTASAARADAELSFDNYSTKENYAALIDAGDRLLAIRGESMTATEDLLALDRPPSVTMAAVHEWTSAWHELAEDRAVMQEHTNQRSPAAYEAGHAL